MLVMNSVKYSRPLIFCFVYVKMMEGIQKLELIKEFLN